MSTTLSTIRDAVGRYLDERAAAQRWDNASYTEEAKARVRAERLAPALQALRPQVEAARTAAQRGSQPLDQALAGIYATGDAVRVQARELAWQRLQARLDAGEDLGRMIRSSRNPIELEAIAMAAPGYLAQRSPNMARDLDGWHDDVRQLVSGRYVEVPELADRFAGPLAEAQQAEGFAAWASVAEGVLEGRSWSEIGGATWTALLAADPDSEPVYDRMRDEGR